MGSAASLSNITKDEQKNLFYLIKNEIDKSNKKKENNKEVVLCCSEDEYNFYNNNEDDDEDDDDEIFLEEYEKNIRSDNENQNINDKLIDNEFDVSSLTNIIEKWSLKTETIRNEVIQCDLVEVEEVLEKSFKSNKTPISNYIHFKSFPVTNNN
jgi:hypothetical protein